jgi:hypothetical protein
MSKRTVEMGALPPLPSGSECPLLYRGIRQEQSYFISLFFGVRFGFGR